MSTPTPEHAPDTGSTESSVLPEPRRKIRAFLGDLFGHLWAEPPPWPPPDVHAFQPMHQALRTRLEQFYAYAASRDDLTLYQKLIGARLFGESALTLMWLDWSTATATHEASAQTLTALQGRPQAITDFDQLYCTPDSTERRVACILEDIDASEGRVLVLGDDDLASIVLAERFDGEVHMLDLDERLLDFVAAKAPKVHRHKVDLIQGGMPSAMYQAFDAVALDPPWELFGAWSFLRKAIFCLRESPYARIYLSFCPIHLQYSPGLMRTFLSRLANHGLEIEAIHRGLNLYHLGDDDHPEFHAIIDAFFPPLDSPFVTTLRQLPYCFSHLYVLRRTPGYKPSPLRRWFFRWWHSDA